MSVIIPEGARLIRGYAGQSVGRPRKFRNEPVIRGGEKYDSKREMARHQALQLLEKNGEVRNIRRQVKYLLDVNGVRITTYRADFVYEERVHFGDGRIEWREIVEDVKGYPNDRWPMKKKLMKAIHGITVTET